MRAFRTGNKIFRSLKIPKRFHTFKFTAEQSQYKVHVPQYVQKKSPITVPPLEVEFDKEEAITMFKDMERIRQFERASEQEYQKRNIRGFLHLYSGQEAVVVGLENEAKEKDPLITAYRCHGHQLMRGDTMDSCMAELFGKKTGCAKGKGGSMHMYKADRLFFGGNGIVGAQVPVGAGLALGLKHLSDIEGEKAKNVAWVYMGDGAANQGQNYEAFNLAKLWNLPVVFVIEDNNYGMGTSIERSSASIEYYTRGDYIPGIKFNGMNPCVSRAAAKHAREYALEYGPIILHASTYRYYGHSMSDPGLYRSTNEVKEVRTERDPISVFQKIIEEETILSPEEIKKIKKAAKKEANQSVKFAIKSDFPEDSEFISDIYVDKEYPVRGNHVFQQFYHKSS